MSHRNLILRVEDSVLDQLRYIAAKNKRSLNGQAELALEEYIEAFLRENGPIPPDDDK